MIVRWIEAKTHRRQAEYSRFAPMSRTKQLQAFAMVCLVLALLATIWLGLVGSDPSAQPTSSETALWVVIATILQVLAGYAFSQVGRVDSRRAKRSAQK